MIVGLVVSMPSSVLAKDYRLCFFLPSYTEDFSFGGALQTIPLEALELGESALKFYIKNFRRVMLEMHKKGYRPIHTIPVWGGAGFFVIFEKD